MTDQERQRLGAILGMLGSAHAGERENAARLAEEFRRQHGLTWEEVLAPVAAAEPETTPTLPDEGLPYEPIQWRKTVLFACFWAAILVGALAFR